MATVDYKVEQVGERSIVVTWSNLANGDEGEALPITGWFASTVQLSGTPGSGLSLAIEQSAAIENPFWVVQSTPFTTAQVPLLGSLGSIFSSGMTRPHVNNGDGSTNVTITLVFHPTEYSIGL